MCYDPPKEDQTRDREQARECSRPRCTVALSHNKGTRLRKRERDEQCSLCSRSTSIVSSPMTHESLMYIAGVLSSYVVRVQLMLQSN